MTKRFSILQKKLQELESELKQVLALPPETPCRSLLSDGVRQRFSFLNSLVAAEMASHPSKPHHLHHIACSLDELEASFTDWESGSKSAPVKSFDAISTCSCTESCLNDGGVASPELSCLVCSSDGAAVENATVAKKAADCFDAVSTCSCTECLNDDGEVSPELDCPIYEVPEASDDEEVLKDEAAGRERDVKKRVGVWRCCGVAVGAVIMGFAMLSLSHGFYYVEHNACQTLTPT